VAELSDAVAAPITVGGQLWGCLAVGFSGRLAPADTEERLARFADLVAMAIGNAEAWSTLSHQAATDALTGLANRRTFQERLQAEISRARRYGRNLSLVLLDLDHFKAVNDTHGHQLGDAVLVEVAERLRTQARDGEVVARFGGEEFAWLMPETDGDAAYLAAERMRHMIGSKPFDHVGVVTVSAGVAAIAHDIDGEELVQLADRGLYRAKDSGRDTSVLESRRAA
jgi:diguanylate cyclase (GGDEF)-like protein